MQWYLKALQNYIGFTGRASRTEYWMFFLFNIIIIFVLRILEAILGILPLITLLYLLAVILPSWAVMFRRLHDTGKSGWWILIALIPVAGQIVLIVFACLDSEGNNKYGTNFNY